MRPWQGALDSGFNKLVDAAIKDRGHWQRRVLPQGALVAVRASHSLYPDEPIDLELVICREKPWPLPRGSEAYWRAAKAWDREVQTFIDKMGISKWPLESGTTKTGGPLVRLRGERIEL